MSTLAMLIVGLGNPGSDYAATRHNAGFWFVDAVAQEASGRFAKESKFFGEVAKVSFGGQTCWLLKPATYMNRSGQAVVALANFYKIAPQSILAVHDELDLAPGDVRLKQGGGHGGHNGLKSIIASIGTADFLRLRLGIGHPGDRNLVTDYVLHAPSREDRQRIEARFLDALAVLPLVLGGDVQRAMNQLHSKKV
jgi:PTH1 family peptidyl-tRNA hydrolase